MPDWGYPLPNSARLHLPALCVTVTRHNSTSTTTFWAYLFPWLLIFLILRYQSIVGTRMAQERTTFALASPCGSMMSLSPSVEGDGKRTMQTTVAIVEENPHRFKIQPLKQVPTEKRPVASPSFNFERPYVGCRLGLPSMYQLAPSRTASTYSFNSVNSDTGTAQVRTAISLDFRPEKRQPDNDGRTSITNSGLCF